MPQFWWVNHNQTVRQEVDGQYLWSPKTESGGARSEFYNNMRRAAPGDLVLSYSGQAIRYVGRVTEFAFTAPKPEEFGQTGAYWSNEGWLLPVFWTPLDPPVRPKAMIATLGPLLPTRYSPINAATGDGNQKAYLAAVSEEVFETVIAGASFSRRALAQGGANSLTFQVVTELLDDAVERRIAEDLALDDTMKTSVIQARRGQGKFRANVEALEQACRLTGITNPSLLIASHIKPWRLCSTAQERLDGRNGLLLTPDADLLFDRASSPFRKTGRSWSHSASTAMTCAAWASRSWRWSASVSRKPRLFGEQTRSCRRIPATLPTIARRSSFRSQPGCEAERRSRTQRAATGSAVDSTLQ